MGLDGGRGRIGGKGLCGSKGILRWRREVRRGKERGEREEEEPEK